MFVYVRFLVVLIWLKESVCPIFIKIDQSVDEQMDAKIEWNGFIEFYVSS